MLKLNRGCTDVVTNSWSYQHKHVIMTAVLATVIIWQNFSYMLPTVAISYESVVVNEPPKYVPCDIDCQQLAWVELRTKEIHAELIGQARIMALQELNQKLDVIIKDAKPN